MRAYNDPEICFPYWPQPKANYYYFFYCNSIYYGIFAFDVSGWVITRRKYLMKAKSYFWIFVLFAEPEKKRGIIIMASIEGVDGSLNL